jgi:translocation protein SEC62
MPETAVPVPPQVEDVTEEVDSAPQPTGLEAAPAGSVVQRQPQRASVEEAEEDE